MLAHTKWHPLPSTRHVAQWTTTTRLAGHLPAWRRLAARALDANPFYEPDYLLASARHLEKDDIRCIAVWRDGSPSSDLIGLFPLQRLALPGGALVPALAFYHNPYVCQTTPLIDREDPTAVWDSFLERCARTPGAPRLIHAPQLPIARATHARLLDALERRGLSSMLISSFERASIKRFGDFGLYMQRLSANRRKDLRRRERRLAELGDVRFRLVTGAEKAAALDQMLEIEHSGWKGDTGTALACNPDTAAFAREAFLGEIGSVALLSAGDRVIAAGACLSSHRTLFTVKIAYDEAMHSFGPGTLLDMKMAETLSCPETGYRRLDSCGVAGDPVESYWLDREPIGSLAFVVSPETGSGWLSGYATAMRNLQRLRGLARDSLRRMRRFGKG